MSYHHMGRLLLSMLWAKFKRLKYFMKESRQNLNFNLCRSKTPLSTTVKDIVNFFSFVREWEEARRGERTGLETPKIVFFGWKSPGWRDLGKIKVASLRGLKCWLFSRRGLDGWFSLQTNGKLKWVLWNRTSLALDLKFFLLKLWTLYLSAISGTLENFWWYTGLCPVLII